MSDVKYVIKRDGSRQPVDLEKIRARFSNKIDGLNMNYINLDIIVQKVANGIYPGMKIQIFLDTF
jgi:transcriptional regulator NrdR family protein